MSKITEFQFIYKDELYDRLNNPEGRSALELSPIGFTWKFNGLRIEYRFKNNGSACALRSGIGFSVVDIENNMLGNAYILSNDGDIIRIIQNPVSKDHSAVFYDTYYIDSYLNFFMNFNNMDYRLLYDESSFSTVDYKYIRY